MDGNVCVWVAWNAEDLYLRISLCCEIEKAEFNESRHRHER